MFIEFLAGYGALRLLSDVVAHFKQRDFQRAEKTAAKHYDLVPAKGQPGVYQDRLTGAPAAMHYQDGQFTPIAIIDFEMTQIKGRYYEFRQ
jgi:hypothetical protein